VRRTGARSGLAVGRRRSRRGLVQPCSTPRGAIRPQLLVMSRFEAFRGASYAPFLSTKSQPHGDADDADDADGRRLDEIDKDRSTKRARSIPILLPILFSAISRATCKESCNLAQSSGESPEGDNGGGSYVSPPIHACKVGPSVAFSRFSNTPYVHARTYVHISMINRVKRPRSLQSVPPAATRKPCITAGTPTKEDQFVF